MILTCPQCATRYLLPVQALAPEGHRVKCSACKEIWFQLPDFDELVQEAGDGEYTEIPDSVKPIPEGSNLPAVHEEEPESKKPLPLGLMGYLTAAMIGIAVFGGLVQMRESIVEKWPASYGLYQFFGMHMAIPGEGLSFDAVRANATFENDGEKFSIEGHIINSGKEERAVPMIMADLRNPQGEVIERWMIRPPVSTIAPEENVSFNTEYRTSRKDAHDIKLKFAAETKTGEEDAGNIPTPQADAPNH